MDKSIVICTALILCSCIVDSRDEVETNTSALTCQVSFDERNNPEAYNRCCIGTEDVCSRDRNRLYGNKIGKYLGFDALSNGSCTNGPSGAYQCVHYAKDTFWHEALRFRKEYWSEPWQYAARGLMVARSTVDNGQNIFVFDNGLSEPPRETDLLIYQNIDRNGNLLAPSDTHPGHVSVVSGVTRNDNGRVTHIHLIEENLIISGNNRELCDDNLSDARMRTVTVSFQNNGYSVASDSSNLQVIGWIRHPLAGIYSDTGWHDDGVVDGHGLSQAFRSAYNRWDKNFLGWSRDNGGTPFVHTRNGHILQDFVTSQGLGRALVYKPNLGTALLIRDGFYAKYLEMESATGLPLDEEHPGVCLSVQNFENGYMCWSGWAVYWFRSGVLPPPGVEPQSESESSPESTPPPPNSESNSEDNTDSDPNEPAPENPNQPAECYSDDWLPCYSGSIGTQNIGLCQGGRTLCSNGHWQWDECVGEITPSSENCLDGLDNDCDSLTDCLDASCADSAGCPSDLGGSEELEVAGEEEQDQDNCDLDQDGYQATFCGGDDCNDANASIHSGALEICNYLDDDCDNWLDEWVSNSCFTCGPTPIEVCGDAFDNDCDQRIDEGCPRDSDGDGFVTMEDCDDLDALQHPGAEEVCNGEDDDCDELIDEGVCPIDTDNDGFLDSLDCAPEDPMVFPNAPESCNYLDDNCDGTIDEGVRNHCGGCGLEPEERCADLMDNDCDGTIDENDVCPLNPDLDNDGILDTSDNCPETYNQGQADIDGDNIGDACDARDDRVFPPEVCDGVDNDNDGIVDEGYECLLNSWADCPTECGSSGRKHCASNCTWSLCFPPTETCWNGADDDCDGYESEDCGAIAGAWCNGANIISNASFEDSLNNWTLNVQGQAQAEILQDCSTSEDGECALRVVIGRQGRWEEVSIGTTLYLVSGGEYQIRLYTRKRDENVGEAPQILISSQDGVTNVGLWSQCVVSEGWSQCAIRFRARDSVTGYRLLLLLGGISGEVLLDEVRVLGCP